MRIGIDARPFKYPEYSGIPYTILEIIKRWMRDDKENEYFLISNTDICLPMELPSNWHRVIRPFPIKNNGTLWQYLCLKNIIKKLKLDAYWGSNYMLPARVKNCRYMLSIYDLAFKKFPEAADSKTLMILNALLDKSVERADSIHSISKATTEDIKYYYGDAVNKVSTIYLGLPKAKDAVMDNVPPYKYFVCVGTIEPRKNSVRVLQAFSEFCDSSLEDIHLVFAGKVGWKTEAFDQELQNNKYKEKIHILGYVEDQQKADLLSGAIALLYPSIYEGFGIPILEAMHYGTPVITSKVSSMPEVGGDAAIYVEDENDPKSIATAMSKAAFMTETDREVLQTKMKSNLNNFSWDECASKIHSLLV